MRKYIMPKLRSIREALAESSDSETETAKPKRTRRKPAPKAETPAATEEAVADTDSNTKDPGTMRDELIRMSESGDLDKSVAYLKKASERAVKKLHAECERRREAKANEFITDMLISKWADLLGGLDAIESPNELVKDLERDQLLRRDVLRAVETLAPFVPFIGIFSGGCTTAKHVYDHKNRSDINSDHESQKS